MAVRTYLLPQRRSIILLTFGNAKHIEAGNRPCNGRIGEDLKDFDTCAALRWQQDRTALISRLRHQLSMRRQPAVGLQSC
jgi:hypothetical protein